MGDDNKSTSLVAGSSMANDFEEQLKLHGSDNSGTVLITIPLDDKKKSSMERFHVNCHGSQNGG